MKLSTLFNSAHSAINKADTKVQLIWVALIFEGFDSDLPNISYTGGSDEIFLEWRGCELSEPEILNIMENEGKITPDSFSTYSD